MWPINDQTHSPLPAIYTDGPETAATGAEPQATDIPSAPTGILAEIADLTIDAQAGPHLNAVDFGTPAEPSGARNTLETTFESSAFFTNLNLMSAERFLDVMLYAFDPAKKDCVDAAAFEALKSRMMACSDNNPKLVGQVMKEKLWRLAQRPLSPARSAHIGEAVAGLQRRLDDNGDYPAYLAANRALIHDLQDRLALEEKLDKEIIQSSFPARLRTAPLKEKLLVLRHAFKGSVGGDLVGHYEILKLQLKTICKDKSNDLSSIDDPLRKMLWQALCSTLPGQQAQEVVQELDAIRQQFEADQCQTTFIEKNRQLIAKVTRQANDEKLGVRQEPLLTAQELDRLSNQIAGGEHGTPAEIARLLLAMVDKVVDAKHAEISIASGLPPDFETVRTREILEHNLPFFLRATATVVRRIAHHPDIENAAKGGANNPSRQIDQTLGEGLALHTRLLAILFDENEPDFYYKDFRDYIRLQPVTPAEFTRIVEGSIVTRQAKNAHFGYAGGTRREEERVVAYYMRAIQLLPLQEARISLGSVLKTLIMDFKVSHAEAVARNQNLSPDLRKALVESTETYVDHWYGFLTDPFATKLAPSRPAAPATAGATAQEIPVHLYKDAVDALDDGTHIADPADPAFVSGGDYLLRTNALYHVMRDEQAAHAAGQPFDRGGFVENSADGNVQAARDYLGALFIGWEASA